MSDLRWYTLKVKTGKELYVKEWLKENKNEIEIDDVIYQLGMEKPFFFQLSYNRPNLYLEIRKT